MTTEQRIIEYMTNYEPHDATLTDGCVTYHSTARTHRSYAAQLINAPEQSMVHRTYLNRCLNWLRLLKKNNIELYNTIKN
ncbi:MAG: hypothetical protein FGM16_10750 [Flavobacterium sp.]|nr:hypothetical protein [Flavobacterium sp.]